MLELLVIDKSIFHSLCDCEEKLCAFVKKYNVVLPNALVAECLISENQEPSKNPVKLLKRFDKAIKAGAKMGYSSLEIFRVEIQDLCPAKSIVDENATKLMRNSTIKTKADLIQKEAECCRNTYEPIIDSLPEIARKLYNNLCKRDKLAKALRKEKDRTRRFENWINATDQEMKNLISQFFSEEIRRHADINWFLWQLTRLYFAYSLDLMFIINLPGSCLKKDISNDFYDIEPVSYLSRADGLLTNDKKLQVPLAKAAFPTKEVFVVDTSKDVQNVLDDITNIIPKSYRIE